MNTVLVVILDIEAAHLGEFVEIVTAHGARSLELEDGCLRFEVLRSDDAANRVLLVEVYSDDAALETHWASGHMQQYREAVQGMIRSRTVHRCHAPGTD